MQIISSEGQRQQMEVESLARFVFRFLKGKSSSEPNRRAFFSVTDLKRALFPDAQDNRSSDEHIKLLEAIVLLERRGLVVRDFSYSEPRLRQLEDRAARQADRFIIYVHLTSLGMQSEFDKILLLVDKPEEIVEELEQKIGTLDNAVRQYYLESLRTYQEGLYISSVICLSVASERAIHWFAEAVESNSEAYQAEIENRKVRGHQRPDAIPLRHSHPQHLDNDKELTDLLNALTNIYHQNHNESGHPKPIPQNWSRDDQEISLLQFRVFMRTICQAIAECYANSKLAEVDDGVDKNKLYILAKTTGPQAAPAGLANPADRIPLCAFAFHSSIPTFY